MVACFVLLELLVARNPSLTTRLGGAWQSRPMQMTTPTMGFLPWILTGFRRLF
jgi:hypothetical protein